jgi:hypothetical protein
VPVHGTGLIPTERQPARLSLAQSVPRVAVDRCDETPSVAASGDRRPTRPKNARETACEVLTDGRKRASLLGSMYVRVQEASQHLAAPRMRLRWAC